MTMIICFKKSFNRALGGVMETAMAVQVGI